MGEVYRTEETRLERQVAIKVLPEDLAEVSVIFDVGFGCAFQGSCKGFGGEGLLQEAGQIEVVERDSGVAL